MKKILVVLSRRWGIKIGHPLVKKLKEEYPNAQFAGLVHMKKTFEMLRRQKDLKYENLWLIDDLWDKVFDFEENLPITTSEIEKELGINSIWELINTVRTLVYDMRSYPIFDYGKTISDDKMLKLAKIFMLHIKEVWEKFTPDIIFTHGFITMYHLMIYYYAKQKGVYMFAVGDTKIKEYYIEHDHPKILMPVRVKEVFDKNLTNHKQSPNYQEAFDYIKKNRQKLDAPDYAVDKDESFNKINKSVRKNLILLPLRVLQNIKRYIISNKEGKSKFKHLDSVGPFIAAKNILRQYFCLKYFKKIKFYKIGKNEKFVYFPLQYEPEAHTMVQALYFINQIDLISATAKALPGDYTLYVKEHPEMLGRRKPGYYKSILGIPNVKFIDYKYSSDDIIRKCGAVVTGTGTSSFEAAILQKPSIMFGEDLTLVLPQIKHVTDYTKLAEIFKEILNDDFSASKYEDALIAYITAIMDAGVKLNYHNLMYDKIELDIFKDFVSKIIKQQTN